MLASIVMFLLVIYYGAELTLDQIRVRRDLARSGLSGPDLHRLGADSGGGDHPADSGPLVGQLAGPAVIEGNLVLLGLFLLLLLAGTPIAVALGLLILLPQLGLPQVLGYRV